MQIIASFLRFAGAWQLSPFTYIYDGFAPVTYTVSVLALPATGVTLTPSAPNVIFTPSSWTCESLALCYC